MASASSTWTFYRDLYGGRLNEQDYTRTVTRAAAEITWRTLGRVGGAAAPPAEMTDQLALCECELVDALYAWAQVPKGVSRTANDGLSLTYGGRNSYDGLADEPGTLERICRKYLTTPCNLMYAGD